MPIEIVHGTTVLAIRYDGGVVMAGDRRATAGYTIANRRVEKVFAADALSGVAIAGAAGPAVELVKLFQVQLEHYEKIEGEILSLEGKANQLGQLVRANLPAAMQGFVVVPLFAGYDDRRGRGRVFSYDATGGKYEEADFQTNGSGGVHARNWIKATWREDISRDEAIDLALRALFAAADEDTATGGPDIVRGIFPTVAAISARGSEAIPDDDRRGACRGAARRARGRSGVVSVPFYVPPEQMIKDKADYARKNIAKGRDLVACSAAEGIVIVTENQFRTLYKISEIYDRIAFGGVGKYNEFENLRVLGVRQADLKGYQFSREDVGARALANAYGADARAGVHPRDEALRGGDPARRGRHHPGRGQAVPHHLRRHGHGRRGLHRARRSRRDHRRRPRYALPTGHGRRRRDPAVRGPAGRPGEHARPRFARGRDPRPRPRRRAFRRIEGPELSTILAG